MAAKLVDMSANVDTAEIHEVHPTALPVKAPIIPTDDCINSGRHHSSTHDVADIEPGNLLQGGMATEMPCSRSHKHRTGAMIASGNFRAVHSPMIRVVLLTQPRFAADVSGSDAAELCSQPNLTAAGCKENVLAPDLLQRHAVQIGHISGSWSADPRREKFLILVRHAESILNACRKKGLAQPWNILRRGVGQLIDPGVKDAPLTYTGQTQAQRAGKRLAKDILMGNLPQIQLVGVSPLRRTLHTSRLIADGADCEIRDKMLPHFSTDAITSPSNSRVSHVNAPPSWWECRVSSDPMAKPQRSLVIIPYLRELRTTSADQPCVKPLQAAEFWSGRNVEVGVLHPCAVGAIDFEHSATKPCKHTQVHHFFTVRLTRRCRQVKVESMKSVQRRIQLVEAWLASRPEDVIMLVGHQAIFREWQRYWRKHSRDYVTWATRTAILNFIRKEQTRGGVRRRGGADRPRIGSVVDAERCSTSNGAFHSLNSSDAPIRRRGFQFKRHRQSSVDSCPPRAVIGNGRPQSSQEDVLKPVGMLNRHQCLFGRILESGMVNRSRKTYSCPNTEVIIARWRPTEHTAQRVEGLQPDPHLLEAIQSVSSATSTTVAAPKETPDSPMSCHTLSGSTVASRRSPTGGSC